MEMLRIFQIENVIHRWICRNDNHNVITSKLSTHWKSTYGNNWHIAYLYRLLTLKYVDGFDDTIAYTWGTPPPEVLLHLHDPLGQKVLAMLKMPCRWPLGRIARECGRQIYACGREGQDPITRSTPPGNREDARHRGLRTALPPFNGRIMDIRSENKTVEL